MQRIPEVDEIAPPAPGRFAGDVDALLDGVRAIGTSGVPGAICVYGPDAFPLVLGEHEGQRAAVVAAARWGQGRVVALGHEGFLSGDGLRSLDTGRLVTNALAWAAGGDSTEPRIGVADVDEFYVWARLARQDAVKISLTRDPLEAIDVLVVVMSKQTEREVRELSDFVSRGGGLVVAGNGWGWLYLNPGRALASDFPGNRLLARLGMRWANAELARTTTGGFAVTGPPGEFTHSGAALVALEGGTRPLLQAEIDLAQYSVRLTSQCLPRDGDLLARLKQSALSPTNVQPPAPSARESGSAEDARTATPSSDARDADVRRVGDVEDLRVSSTARGVLEITWSAAEPAPTDYWVAWAKHGDEWPSRSDLTRNAFTAATSYTVRGLTPGAVYHVSVRTRYRDGSGADSFRRGPWAPAQPVRVLAPPLAPTGVTATATQRGVVLEWDAPPGDTVTDYEVERVLRDGAGRTRIRTRSTQPRYVDIEASPESRYVYVLRAINRDGKSPASQSIGVTTLARLPGRDDLYEQTTPPVHATSIWWHWDSDGDAIREMTVDFTIHNNLDNWSLRNGYYLMLLHGKISDVTFYFGFQTGISHAGAPRVKGVIYSRWDTRDLAFTRADPVHGWTQSAGYEGDFIGVRRAYNWSAGDYQARIAPDGLDSDGEWFSVWITDLSTDETTWIGSLKFPLIGASGAINPYSYSTLELYGRPTRPIDTPEWYVTIDAPLADGVLPEKANTDYPYDDREGRAMLNSDSLFDPEELTVHLRIGGTTERVNPPQRNRIE